MQAALLAVLLPSLFWDRPVDTAGTLRQAGIERISVPPGREGEWSKLGFQVRVIDTARAAKAVVPKVEYQMDVASATRAPWVDANGWRFLRNPHATYFYDVPAGSAALAAGEAFAYGVEAAVRSTPEDAAVFARMLKFLGGIGGRDFPGNANIGITEDGSEEMGEVLNLMARHNLLFEMAAPEKKYDLTIRLGEGEFTRQDAADPYQFALKVRRQLTDEKRLLRIYGSNVVLARLKGLPGEARIHLLNYGAAAVSGLHVRVLGSYAKGKLYAFEHEGATLSDYVTAEGSTEFTIPEIGAYAMVDLGN